MTDANIEGLARPSSNLRSRGQATDFTLSFHPEKHIDGFTVVDGTVRFYNFVKAILLKTNARQVLDFGAGRGGFWHDDQSVYRRHLRDLRTTGATVTACDVDRVVLAHPCSDRQVVINPNEATPFADEEFDVIVSDMTFEHLQYPLEVGRELLRILKLGGWICARTPNNLGYVRMVAGLIPNRMHKAVLERVQPSRKEEDVFPTFYRLNSLKQARRAFPECSIYHYCDFAEPAYYFGRPVLYRIIRLVHKVLPAFMGTSICFFIVKQMGAEMPRD